MFHDCFFIIDLWALYVVEIALSSSFTVKFGCKRRREGNFDNMKCSGGEFHGLGSCQRVGLDQNQKPRYLPLCPFLPRHVFIKLNAM